MNTVNEIRPIKEAKENDLLKLSGVTGVGIGNKLVNGNKTDELSIRVYVAEKKKLKDVPDKERIPGNIKGIKTDVIQRKFVLYERLMRVADLKPKVDTGTYDPLRGGMSIGPCRSVYLNATEAVCQTGPGAGAGWYIFAGTLGCIVMDNVTNAEMLLSNFHVMCVDDTWQVGDTMCQPSRLDGGSCPADVVGSLQRTVLSNQVDGAIASHTARGHQCSILDIGNVTGTATATLGMAVRKRGRTTELTYGNVSDIDMSVSINYCNGLGIRTLIHQIGIDANLSQNAMFGTGGDSGSVVVNSSGEVVGLYFAGDETGEFGVANPIAAVLSELNVRICVGKIWEIKKDFDIKSKDIKKLEYDYKSKDHDIKKQEIDIKKIENEPIIGKTPNEPITPTKGLEQPIGVGQTPVGQTPVGQTPVGQTPVGQIPVGQIPVGQTPVGQTPVGQTPIDSGWMTSPSYYSLEQRIARIEAALAQLTHFIQSKERPNLENVPLQNERDYGRRSRRGQN